MDMSLTLAVLLTLYLLGLRPGLLSAPRRWPYRLPRFVHRPEVETIRYVDGPLVGVVEQIAVGRDGFPPLQFCAVVRREDRQGGDYTLPYQRGVICEADRIWHYTQGWNEADLAGQGVES